MMDFISGSIARAPNYVAIVNAFYKYTNPMSEITHSKLSYIKSSIKRRVLEPPRTPSPS